MSYTSSPHDVKAKISARRLDDACTLIETTRIPTDHFLRWIVRHFPEVANSPGWGQRVANVAADDCAPDFAALACVLRVIGHEAWTDDQKADVLLDLAVVDVGRA